MKTASKQIEIPSVSGTDSEDEEEIVVTTTFKELSSPKPHVDYVSSAPPADREGQERESDSQGHETVDSSGDDHDTPPEERRRESDTTTETVQEQPSADDEVMEDTCEDRQEQERRTSSRSRKPPSWQISGEYIMAQQCVESVWQNKLSCISGLIRSGVLQKEPSKLSEVLALILTR